MRAGSLAAAAVLWAPFVAALQVDGTWELLGGDLVPLSAFACGFALLIYALDTEARASLHRMAPGMLAITAAASVTLAWVAPRAVALLVALPVLAVAAVALARRGGVRAHR